MIKGIIQPEIIKVDDKIRLRKFDDHYDFALSWYQDKNTCKLVDGEEISYDEDRLTRMYHYLDNQGELYFIEFLENDEFIPIGDVTFWENDMPIVIGDIKYRGLGIGKKVICTLIERGKQLGYTKMEVNEIYKYNIASIKCFESAGFKIDSQNENSVHMIYELNK